MTEDLDQMLAQSAWSCAREPKALLLERATRHVVDFLGVYIAGTRAPEMDGYLRVLRADVGRSGNGAPFSIDEPLPKSAKAAFIGAAGHFHDFDDDDPAVSIGHPTVPVVSAALATIQPRQTSLELLGAYISGIETMCRIGACVNPAHYNRGAHATASLGVFGAAAASCLVQGGDPEALAAAFGFSATSSSGLKAAFGSSGKPIQVGSAAARGSEAAAQAIGGLRPSRGVVFGRAGWVDMNGGLDGARAAISDFARPHIFEAPGINIKRYPCCSSSHTAIDGVLDLIGRRKIGAAEIEKITIWIGPDVPGILIYDRPRTGLEGKFSLKFPIAVAVLKGSEPSLDDFSDARANDARITNFMDRVAVEIDPNLPREIGGVTHCARVRIDSGLGHTDEIFVEHPIGSVRSPMDDAGLKKKFLACASPTLGPKNSEIAFDGLMRMSNGIPMADVFCLLGMQGG